jgi:dihydrofolate reductase
MEKDMTVNAILAHDDRWGIGKDNGLPWPRNAADMKWFRECTIGHVVVMGRKTWESIGSKPLPKRVNVVVSSRRDFPHPKDGGPDHVLSSAKGVVGLGVGIRTLMSDLYPGLKVWIIGGADIYEQTLPTCDNIYLTHIPGDYECDTFVSFDKHLSRFIEVAKKEQDGLTFRICKRV